MLDVRRMRVLREVARHGTIASAAQALDLTPSAVSQQLATLEAEAGIALVDRGPSSLVLTEAGRSVVRHADIVLAQLADAEAELRAIGGLRAGQLHVGSFASVAELTTSALRRLRERHPEVSVTVTESETDESLEQLRSGRLDVALVYSYDHAELEPGSAIELHELMRDPSLVAVARTHPLAARPSVRLGELAQDRWITQGPGTACQRVIQGACREAGFEPQLQNARSDDYRIIQALVAAELGVAFVPWLARQPESGVAFVAPEERVGRTIAAACRTGGRRTAAVATMIELLSELARDLIPAGQPG